LRRIPVPFFKAHAARNDFLLTWAADLAADVDRARMAAILCDRHAGIGADGWYVLSKADDADVAATLYNADGSVSELSGNGSRCIAALLFGSGHPWPEPVTIRTGAGLRKVRLVEPEGAGFRLEMEMGSAPIEGQERLETPMGVFQPLILRVGNPQCAVPVEGFDFDWRTAGAALERHPRFPNRTNVSFLRRRADEHSIEVRIWERGVGETESSGTGATGAAAAARYLGWVHSPASVLTAAGPLDVRWEGEEYFLTGPAQVIAKGEFF
jgi:diaminopimelate epimerase